MSCRISISQINDCGNSLRDYLLKHNLELTYELQNRGDYESWYYALELKTSCGSKLLDLRVPEYTSDTEILMIVKSAVRNEKIKSLLNENN